VTHHKEGNEEGGGVVTECNLCRPLHFNVF